MAWVDDRRHLAALAVAYVVGLAVLVAGPWGWTLNRLTVRLYTLFRYDWRIAPEWVRPEQYGVLLNVVLFVPAGALLAVVARRPWWWATLAALAASAVIELVQWLWLEREGGWSDVGANTLGALIGALAGAVLIRRRTRARRPPAARALRRRRP